MNYIFNETELIEDLNQRFRENHDYYNMNEKIKSWFEALEYKEDRYIYLKLLDKFKFYSRKNIIECLKEIHLKVLEFDKSVDCTLFFPMFSKNGRNNHSFEVHNMYREANYLNKACFIVDVNYALNNIPMDKIFNIVFVDDMIGSGTTIETSIVEIYEKYKDLFEKNIYISIIEVPENIEDIKDSIESKIGKKINILYLYKHKKAFSEDFIFEQDYLESAKSRVRIYEEQLNKKSNDIFGHENSEFLLSFYYDTPNNTLTSLWKSNEKIGWKPPFSRNTICNHRPSWMVDISSSYKNANELKNRKQNIKNMNYKLKSR